MTKRELNLTKARIAGYHGDNTTFTRLAIEARINRDILKAAWRDGVLARDAGIPCNCNSCVSNADLSKQIEGVKTK